jgi:hypothetical protein
LALFKHGKFRIAMKRFLTLAALVVAAAAACQDDTQGPTSEDLRVQDSVLNHEVMAAWGDSFRVTVEEPQYNEAPAQKAPATQAAKTPVATERAAPPPPLIAAPIPLPQPRPASRAAVVATREPRRETSPVTRARSIRKGSLLSLVTSERVCTSRVGETFGATVLSPIATTSGTIPSGARATAEITGNDQWGAGIGVRVRAIHANGATYPVNSRVTYIVPENSGAGACIPRRAHIDTEVRG